jgi:hypothetical protein
MVLHRCFFASTLVFAPLLAHGADQTTAARGDARKAIAATAPTNSFEKKRIRFATHKQKEIAQEHAFWTNVRELFTRKPALPTIQEMPPKSEWLFYFENPLYDPNVSVVHETTPHVPVTDLTAEGGAETKF